MKVHPVHVFISYSHLDSIYIERKDGDDPELIRMLRGLEEEGIVLEYDKQFLTMGDLFNKEIKAKLERCDILITLLSQDFLQSEYCQHVEVRRMLRPDKGSSRLIVPFLLRPCEWERVDWLRERTIYPNPHAKSFAELPKAARTHALIELKKAIRRHALTLRAQRS